MKVLSIAGRYFHSSAVPRCPHVFSTCRPDSSTNIPTSPHKTFSETTLEIDTRRSNSAIDVAEHEYRTRYQPSYHKEPRSSSETTVDSGRFAEPQQSSIQDTTTVAEFVRPQGSTFSRKTKVVAEITAPSTVSRKSNKMGFYDEDGESLFPSVLFSLPCNFRTLYVAMVS